jgi:protein-arginine kinase activator protein McsA
MNASEQKTEVKKKIRMLKAKRDEALGQKDYKQAKKFRRGIRALKRQTRLLARAAKVQAADAAAAPAASA